jgi:hypothetical protein
MLTYEKATLLRTAAIACPASWTDLISKAESILDFVIWHPTLEPTYLPGCRKGAVRSHFDEYPTIDPGGSKR